MVHLFVFTGFSLMMMWRLEAMLDHGLEGTVLGTLIMPYCSGLGNLIFVALMIAQDGAPREVMTNCLVNNVTSLTLLLGLFALCKPLPVSEFFLSGLLLLLGAVGVHSLLLLFAGGLPRWAGVVLTTAYAWFVWRGLLV